MMSKLARRSFLRSSIGSLLALGLPGAPVFADGEADDLRFVFLWAGGGWDPLAVFAPMYSSPNIDMNPDTAVRTIGNISFVDHPDRPSVPAFFERWGAQSIVINGLSVRNIGHESCERLVLTGSSTSVRADWATLAATVGEARFTAPHLVLSGPAHPGDHGVLVTRSGTAGQLHSLLDGELLELLDDPFARLPSASESRADALVRARANRRLAAAETPLQQRLHGRFVASLERADALKAVRDDLSLGIDVGFLEQIDTAIEVLRRGFARCVTLEAPGSWDSHARNEESQGPSFAELFEGLTALLDGLSDAELLPRTVVVALSEMGRTPKYNGQEGRDHWPYTSVLLAGGGLRGDRVLGGYDGYYNGLGIDPASLESSPDATPFDVEALGTTLLTLAGADPAELLPRSSAQPLEGLR